MCVFKENLLKVSLKAENGKRPIQYGGRDGQDFCARFPHDYFFWMMLYALLLDFNDNPNIR